MAGLRAPIIGGADRLDFQLPGATVPMYDTDMESIIRNVKDIPLDDRRGLEHVVGRQLADNQQIIIQVMTITSGDELSETYPAQSESALRAGWDDPAMDEYNEYDKHRRG